MQVNLIKLIKDLLITFVRDNKLVMIIYVLVSEARTSFNAFMQSVPDWKYKARANGSVLSLQHTIKRELDVDAVITELSGKPFDYLVTVNGYTDETRLRNVLDTFSIAGKSYCFENGLITYSCEFTNHFCALTLEDNPLTLTFNGTYWFVTSESPVASLLDIVAVFEVGAAEPLTLQFTIPEGESQSNNRYISVNMVVASSDIVTVEPEMDYEYIYTF